MARIYSMLKKRLRIIIVCSMCSLFAGDDRYSNPSDRISCICKDNTQHTFRPYSAALSVSDNNIWAYCNDPICGGNGVKAAFRGGASFTNVNTKEVECDGATLRVIPEIPDKIFSFNEDLQTFQCPSGYSGKISGLSYYFFDWKNCLINEAVLEGTECSTAPNQDEDEYVWE